MTTRFHLCAWAASLLLLGCGQRDQAAWALQHGSLLATDSGEAFDGFQIWEFYAKRWRKKKKEKFHLCARVQSIQGELSEELAGCDGCEVTFALSTEELEADCAEGQGDGAGFAGVTHFALGAVPKNLHADRPYPGQTMAWYISWDAQTVEVLGYAWNERLDQGEEVSDGGWSAGERYVLWPAFAWEL